MAELTPWEEEFLDCCNTAREEWAKAKYAPLMAVVGKLCDLPSGHVYTDDLDLLLCQLSDAYVELADDDDCAVKADSAT